MEPTVEVVRKDKVVRRRSGTTALSPPAAGGGGRGVGTTGWRRRGRQDGGEKRWRRGKKHGMYTEICGGT